MSRGSSIGGKLISVLLLCCLEISGQQDRNPDRGFRAHNSYSISDIENVNMINGNMMLTIPLASLPAGRGTTPGYTVSLHYNSKNWNAIREFRNDGIDDGTSTANYIRELIGLSEQGGWHLDYGQYSLGLVNRLEIESEAPCVPNTGENEYRRNGYAFKLELRLPNGSIVAFHPYGSGPDYTQYPGFQDGFYPLDPYGVRHHYSWGWDDLRQKPLCTTSQVQVTTAGINYFTDDGSGLRLFVPHQPGIGVSLMRWTLFFPDGRVVENRPQDDPGSMQRTTDRNGNKIVVKPGSLNGTSGVKIENDTGHFIFITLGFSENKIIQPGHGGEQVETTLRWSSQWVYHNYTATHAFNANPAFINADLLQELSLLERIVLPWQAGSREYAFTYYAAPTRPTTAGSYTDGWGQLASIRLPSGAVAEYSYGLSGNFPGMDSTVLSSDIVTARKLNYTTKYDGQEQQVSETTSYESGGGAGRVCPPNGNCQNHVSAVGGDLNGYAYRIEETGGSVVEKIWIARRQMANGTFLKVEPFVKTEFSSIPDAAGNPVLTATKDFEYDQNGNILEVKEYDWVPYDSIPRSSIGAVNEFLIVPRPTGLPSGLVLKRRTINTYYYATPNKLDPVGNSANHYANPSAPRLLNLIRSSEVRDASGSVVSRTEYSYDGGLSSPNRGNLTETRFWDSTKGVSSNPLIISNSISTSTEYDAYGSPTLLTNANSVQTRLTYGPIQTPTAIVEGLYPTKTVTAHGTALAKTSTAIYDFHTGLITTATDVDNNVSNITEYDALGRATKVRTAAGSTKESWTRIEYNDVARRVLVRSDFESVGDGRRTVIQHFDQLGRIRLARTLENALEDPLNEAHGIKVQTRYQTADPHTFQLVSNPYKASTSALAGNEPTMGWTRSKIWNHGRREEMETFAGAGLPAPWGSNGVSTGLIVQEIDGNAATSTDQAEKRRRDIMDSIGRLVRVDEPDESNNLGAVSSPVQPTSYSYDALGNLRQVVQGVQTRTFTYSSLSRLISASNPESGLTGYSYDNNGNLLRRTDARGVVTTHAYDAHNRVLSQSYSDGTPAITYGYDSTSVPFSQGKLTSVSSSVSSYDYLAYDELGQVESVAQRLGTRNYNIVYSYYLGGSVKTMRYPSGRIASYTYDFMGRLQSFAGNLGGGASRSYSSETVYDAASRMTKEKLGTATAIFNKLFYNSRGQLAEIRAGTSYASPTDKSADRGAVVNHYSNQPGCNGSTCNGSDNNGNLMRQEIQIANGDGFLQYYAYDSLNRLKSVRENMNGGATTWQQAYIYDRYSNRTIDQANTFGSGIPKPNFAVDPSNNRLVVPNGQTGTMSYDAAGNLTSDTYSAGAVLRKYDAENRMTSETQSTNAVVGSYGYDGNGQRVIRDVNGVITWQIHGVAGELLAEYPQNGDPTAPSTEYGYRNGKLLITATTTGGWGAAPLIDDNPLNPPGQPKTDVKAIHITQLRAAINALRSHYNLPNYQWQKPTVSGGVINNTVLISWEPINEMRTALNEALGAPSNGYTAGLASNQPILAAHIQELRDRVLAAWQAAGGIDIRWLIVDHLGTPRIIFDQSGSLATASRHDYLPFGEELFAGTGGRTPQQNFGADNLRQKFTQYERDTETSLDFAQARYYASKQGRFTSVDPLLASAKLSQPQSWNRYAYVLNNPLKLVDPSGLTPEHTSEEESDRLQPKWQQSQWERDPFEQPGKFQNPKQEPKTVQQQRNEEFEKWQACNKPFEDALQRELGLIDEKYRKLTPPVAAVTSFVGGLLGTPIGGIISGAAATGLVLYEKKLDKDMARSKSYDERLQACGDSPTRSMLWKPDLSGGRNPDTYKDPPKFRIGPSMPGDRRDPLRPKLTDKQLNGEAPVKPAKRP